MAFEFVNKIGGPGFTLMRSVSKKGDTQKFYCDGLDVPGSPELARGDSFSAQLSGSSRVTYANGVVVQEDGLAHISKAADGRKHLIPRGFATSEVLEDLEYVCIQPDSGAQIDYELFIGPGRFVVPEAPNASFFQYVVYVQGPRQDTFERVAAGDSINLPAGELAVVVWPERIIEQIQARDAARQAAREAAALPVGPKPEKSPPPAPPAPTFNPALPNSRGTP